MLEPEAPALTVDEENDGESPFADAYPSLEDELPPEDELSLEDELPSAEEEVPSLEPPESLLDVDDDDPEPPPLDASASSPNDDVASDEDDERWLVPSTMYLGGS